MKNNEFRAWLDKKGLTLQAFVKSIHGISYGFAAKCASTTARPKAIHEGSKALIRAAHPDCPLVR